MLTFKELTFKNFKSYGNVVSTVRFDRNQATLVVGEDLDNTSNGKTSNGVGKTSIIDALLYSLYDRVLDSEVSVNELINLTNKKNLEVSISFERNGKNYFVRRYRKTKEGTGVFFSENGVDMTAGSNSDETNKKIVAAIGIPYELFVRIIVFPARQEAFLKLPSRSTSKRENQSFIIEELFGYSFLSQKAKYLKDVLLKQAEQEFAAEETRKKLHETRLADHAKQLTNAMQRAVEWEATRTSGIAEIKRQLAEIENVDITSQQNAKDLYNDLQMQIKTIDSAITQLDRHLSIHKRDHQKNQTEIVSLANSTCPYCKQHMPDARARIAVVKEASEELSVQISATEQKLSTLRGERVSLVDDAKDVKAILDATDAERLITLINQRAKMEAKIVALEQSSNPHRDVIADLDAVKLEPFDDTKLNELANLIKHRKFLLALLTKKDSFVRKAILDRDLPFLNGRLHHYKSRMGLPHKIEFTPDMTVSITRHDDKLSIGSLSAGQAARCNFALAVSFRDVLQSQYGSVNICLMDEVFDIGLDSMGIFAAASIVRDLAQQENLNIFVISHREEIETFFNNQLHVKFKEGFSVIE